MIMLNFIENNEKVGLLLVYLLKLIIQELLQDQCFTSPNGYVNWYVV